MNTKITPQSDKGLNAVHRSHIEHKIKTLCSVLNINRNTTSIFIRQNLLAQNKIG